MLVFDGFSKAYGMTGWRLGFAHGPRRLIEEMIKLQQFTFVCAPSMVQHAGVAAWDFDVSAHRRRLPPQARPHLRRARRTASSWSGRRERSTSSQGAAGHAAREFVAEAIRNKLLIIPGNVFSRRDTHFRLSYAADDRTLDRGIEILNRLARRALSLGAQGIGSAGAAFTSSD